MQASQVSAMVRYEMLMHWRRRGIVMTMLTLLVLVVGLTLLLTQGGVSMETQIRDNLPPDTPELNINTTVAMYTLLVVMMAFSVAVPVMTAETVPLDHQYRVTDMLNSLPMNRTTYLLGKLLGIWSSLLLGVALCSLICCAAMWLLLGEFDLVSYLLMWLVYVVPLVLFSSALSVLVASTQPSRRRGVLLVAPLSLYPYVVVLISMNSVWALMMILRPQIVSRLGSMATISHADIAAVYAFLLANIIAAWGVAWLWQRFREGR